MTTNDTAVISAHKKKGGLRWFQVVFILAFVGLLVFAFKATLLGLQAYPTQLGNLDFQSKVDGEQALAEVSQLHGENISLASASIIYYGSGQEHASVWVGKASSEQAADDLLQRMASAIKKSGGAFTNLQQISVNGQSVYQVNGPDGQHFFFAKGDKVIWLIVQSPQPRSILSATMEEF